MIFVRRADRYLPAAGVTFRRFMEEGVSGERAALADWADHLTTLFPEARAKRVIEVRSADAADAAMTAGLPALWKGVLYSDDARVEAEALLAGVSFAERVALQDDVSRRALRAEVRGRRVGDLVRELLRIAAHALAPDERALLAPLEARARRGVTPAEDALAAWEAAGKDPRALVKHWAY
jgi:glutamate--cysteine ligase